MTNLFSYSKKKSSGSLSLFEESLCVLKKGNQKLLHSYSPIERKSVNGIIRISKQKASAAPYKHPKQKRKRERESDIYKIYSIIAVRVIYIRYIQLSLTYYTLESSRECNGQRRISRRVAKFLLEINTFHIKSKAIKILPCKNSATLLDLPLIVIKNCFVVTDPELRQNNKEGACKFPFGEEMRLLFTLHRR